MKKFYLFCSAGMSTSLLASSIPKKWQVLITYQLKLKPFLSQIDEIVESVKPDVDMLGPDLSTYIIK